MALDKTTLKSSILSALDTAAAEADPNNAASARATLAQSIADAIDVYVKGATVSTTVTVVSVSGVTTGPGVSGPGTGTGTGTLA